MKRTPFGFVLMAYLLACLVWGHTSFVSRITLQGYPTFVAAALRMTLAALAALALWCASNGLMKRHNWQHWRAMILAGVMNGIGLAGIYWALRSITGGLVTTILALQPVAVTVLGCFFGARRATVLNLMGALVAFAGLSLIFWERLLLSAEQGAAILVMAASAVLLGASYFPLNSARELPIFARLALVFIPMAIVLWLVAGLETASIDWMRSPGSLPLWPSVGVIYLGIVGMVVPFLAFFLVLNEWGEVTAATMDFMIPLVALTTDRLFEKEPTGLGMLGALGITLVLMGVALTLRKRQMPVPVPEATATSS
jgi:drug/metabolite transporter (DMT)-like permease